jgi:predicted NBD/HSP70 family sugar kinase
VRNAELAGAISTSTADPDGAIARLAALATTGDPRVLQVLSEAGTALGIALSAAINMLDVPVVVLGGIYARLGEWLRASISGELDNRVTSRRWEPLDLRISALGTDAAVRGAAGSVIQQVLAAAGPVAGS